MARILIDGKRHHVGTYDDEEEAAVDYARAVFKFRSGDAEVRREQAQKVDVFETEGKSNDSPSYALTNDAKDANQGANANEGQEMKEDAVKTVLSNHTASVRALFLGYGGLDCLSRRGPGADRGVGAHRHRVQRWHGQSIPEWFIQGPALL